MSSENFPKPRPFAFIRSFIFAFRILGRETTRITLFRKEFIEVISLDPPPMVHGIASEVPGEPFLGNSRTLLQTLLQTLLPIDPSFDMAMNIFTYSHRSTFPSPQ